MLMNICFLSHDQLVGAIRVGFDCLLLCLGLMKIKKGKETIEETIAQRVGRIPEGSWESYLGISSATNAAGAESYGGFSILCTERCTVDYVRLYLILSNGGSYSEFRPFVNIQIEVGGNFGDMQIDLPFLLNADFVETESYELHPINNHSQVVLTDKRPVSSTNRTRPIRLAGRAAMTGFQTPTNFRLALPLLVQPQMTGQPWSTLRTLPDFKPNEGGPSHYYYPAIERLEIIIEQPPLGYEFAHESHTPTPEFMSEKQCRWISTNQPGSRPHSSVFTRINRIGAAERVEIQRLRNGLSIGLWTGISVTVAIDLVWTLVSLL
jgi:hypothetical protein